jgi:urease accessory protein
MYAAALRSDPEDNGAFFAPVRAQGRIRLVYGLRGTKTVALETGEGGGYRARFPHTDHMAQTVLINTGGGMTGGDAARFDITAGAGTQSLVTTQSAEKIYRSNGPDARVDVALTLCGGSTLHWLPQETILFSGARLNRCLHVEMAEDASLLLNETVIFGRVDSGEVLGQGFFMDQWRVRRAGRLVLAEATRMEGALSALLARPAAGNGARAISTIVYAAPDAPTRLEEARALLDGVGWEAGATVIEDLLIIRLLDSVPGRLRSGLNHFLTRFRAAPLPALW